MERHFDIELQNFNTNILKMATLTEEAIHKSVEALKTRNKDLATKVIIEDQEIDELENIIEEQTIELLALYQPMAKDLRFITTGMRLSTDLERIADLAVNICQRTIEIADQPLLKPLVEIPQLADNAKKMVKNAIDAFVSRNDDLARNVILSDKTSNELRTIIMNELVEDYLLKDSSTAPRAIALLLVARDLERISDHAAAISEDVIYMIHAKLIKHHRDQLQDNT